MTLRLWIASFVVLLAFPLIGYSLDGEEDAHSAGCLPKESVKSPSAVCASCHDDAQKRYATNHHHPCTPYCIECHKKTEMDRHHSVGTQLPRDAHDALILTSRKQIACTTCHDLSQSRYDKVRWKATSLYDRLFRNESRHKTYFLSMRNDHGQLCLTCH